MQMFANILLHGIKLLLLLHWCVYILLLMPDDTELIEQMSIV